MYRPKPIIGQKFHEKCSWFGFAPGWVDGGDNGLNASGLPQSTPGIAFYCRNTLTHWWRVVLPNGNIATVQQVDLGPHPKTGRGIDINATLASAAGYTPKNFPTDAKIEFTYLGKKSK